jgi:hypothetical protein
MIKKITQKRIIPISLFVLVGCTGVNWLTTEIAFSQVVAVQTAEIDLSLAREKAETYEDFLRRAEATATKMIQSRFKQDASISELRVTINGENQGAIAPILSLKVSRSSWSTYPEIQRWATYYPDSKFLLGFEQQIARPQPQTPPAEQPQPNQPQSPQQPPNPETQSPIPAEQPQQEQPQSPFQRLTPGEQGQPSESSE